MSATACLSQDDVLALLQGRVSAQDRSRVDEHVDSCRRCFELLGGAVESISMVAPVLADGPLAPSEPPSAPPASLHRGQVVGNRYEIRGILGVGGMGVVYLAFDPLLDRRVALKILRPDTLLASSLGAVGSPARERLFREARTLGKLSHPNVVTVHDVGNLDGDVFIVLEYVEGKTAREWQEERPRPPGEIVELYIEASRALVAAHAVGIVHLDFKPDNVLVGSDGRVRVTDFGLAQILSYQLEVPPDASVDADLGDLASGSSVFRTTTGVAVGTPAYMAPEQHLGLPVDFRSDQFSFCVSLYEALHGVRPFAGRTLAEYRAEVLRGGCRPAPEESAVPAAIHAALLRGLSQDPADRFPSMEALVAALVLELTSGVMPPSQGSDELDVPRSLRGTLAGFTGGWDLARRDVLNSAMGAAKASAPVWSPYTGSADDRTARWLDVVRSSQDAFAARDIERYTAHFTDDCIVSEPTIAHLDGRESLVHWLAGMFAFVTSITLEEMHLVPLGRMISMKSRLRITSKTGRSGALDGVVLFEMSDQDKIARMTSFYDPALVAALMEP